MIEITMTRERSGGSRLAEIAGSRLPLAGFRGGGARDPYCCPQDSLLHISLSCRREKTVSARVSCASACGLVRCISVSCGLVHWSPVLCPKAPRRNMRWSIFSQSFSCSACIYFFKVVLYHFKNIYYKFPS